MKYTIESFAFQNPFNQSHKFSLTDENRGTKLASLLPRFSRHLLQLLCKLLLWKDLLERVCLLKETPISNKLPIHSFVQKNVILFFFNISFSWKELDSNTLLMEIRIWVVNYWNIGKLARKAANRNSEITWQLIHSRGYETIELFLKSLSRKKSGKFLI